MVVVDRACALAAKIPPWLERLLLVVVIWQVAGVFWWAFAPSTEGGGLALPRPVPANNVSREAFLRWYGSDAKAGAPAASDYSLMAVIAGKNGAALLKGSDGTSVAVRVGEEIRPGSRLVAVEPLGAMIEQGGVRQEVKLPQAGTQSLFSRNDQPAPASSVKRAVLKPVRITRGQMMSVIQSGNVAHWDKGMSVAADGGIRIDKAAAQPFAKLLQFNDGDILKRINQRPLDRLADISLLSFYFGQHNSVDIELVRRGAPMIQHYDIQP
ncbi:hypothetical protein [Propionivibrio limicola]|uniref:hypothetical protein n=1 Tax=Propionivibrio limicola TaxID=167645 RepID=UPI001291A389|nr:hypothetical protein [Propionivibrio limicola]